MLKDFFMEKLENKKLLTRKIVKSKIRVTADENLVSLTIDFDDNCYVLHFLYLLNYIQL